jgi:membrane fusion protein (multidrug efflux system)
VLDTGLGREDYLRLLMSVGRENSREEALKEPAAVSGGAPGSSPPGTPPDGKVPFWQHWPVVIAGTLVLFGLLVLGLGYLAESLTGESTDDAFIDGHIIALAPKVAGQVKSVFVDDNQPVKAGDLVVEIDPRDLAAVADQKRAAGNAARANVELLKASWQLAQAQLAAAEATANQSQAEAAAAQAAASLANADFKRAQELIDRKTISPQEFDRAQAAMTAADANLRAAQQKQASDQSKIAQATAQVEASRLGVERAQALAQQAAAEQQTAELKLSYTRLTAPEDGRVTRKTVEPGDYLQAGQNVMAIVSWQIWVTANFKETQLERIRTNQLVKIRIDSLAGGPFRGHVASIQAGSGARFTLLPPENAVGNFVKVVQRVPVKILFDEPGPALDCQVLGPGMSVVPWVKVTEREISPAMIKTVAAAIALTLGLLWFKAAARRRRA